MSSAGATAFSAIKLYGPAGFLWLDGNGKITAGNGTLDKPKPNAFSLVHIDDCPGSTETCRASCYVHGLKKHAPDTFDLYKQNSFAIRLILKDPVLAREWAGAMARWIRDNAAGGFRWHVSGDVFSLEYARWIAMVCEMSSEVRHWIYTRSFDFIEPLVQVCTENRGPLALNLSCDKNNWALAKGLAREHGLRLCYLSDNGRVPETLRTGDVIFPDYGLRGTTDAGKAWFADLPAAQKKMVCPVDYKGKSERRRCGPCARCML